MDLGCKGGILWKRKWTSKWKLGLDRGFTYLQCQQLGLWRSEAASRAETLWPHCAPSRFKVSLSKDTRDVL